MSSSSGGGPQKGKTKPTPAARGVAGGNGPPKGPYNPKTSHNSGAKGQNAGKSATSQGASAKAGKAEPSKSGKQDQSKGGKPDQGKGGAPKGGKADPPKTGKADPPKNGKSDPPKTGKSDQSKSGKAEQSKSGKAEQSKSGKSDQSKSGKADPSKGGKTDKSGKSGSSQKPDLPKSAKPDLSKSSKQKNEKQDSSETVNEPKSVMDALQKGITYNSKVPVLEVHDNKTSPKSVELDGHNESTSEDKSTNPDSQQKTPGLVNHESSTVSSDGQMVKDIHSQKVEGVSSSEGGSLRDVSNDGDSSRPITTSHSDSFFDSDVSRSQSRLSGRTLSASSKATLQGSDTTGPKENQSMSSQDNKSVTSGQSSNKPEIVPRSRSNSSLVLQGKNNSTQNTPRSVSSEERKVSVESAPRPMSRENGSRPVSAERQVCNQNGPIPVGRKMSNENGQRPTSAQSPIDSSIKPAVPERKFSNQNGSRPVSADRMSNEIGSRPISAEKRLVSENGGRPISAERKISTKIGSRPVSAERNLSNLEGSAERKISSETISNGSSEGKVSADNTSNSTLVQGKVSANDAANKKPIDVKRQESSRPKSAERTSKFGDKGIDKPPLVPPKSPRDQENPKWAAKQDISQTRNAPKSPTPKSAPSSAPPSVGTPSLGKGKSTENVSATLEYEQKLKKSSSTSKLNSAAAESNKPSIPKSASATLKTSENSRPSLKSAPPRPSDTKSGPQQNSLPSVAPNRVLLLAQKNEWQVLDQVLRNMDKNNPAGINSADKDNGFTPLMIAVKENRLVVSERLLDLGANVNTKSKDGRTCLHFAAASSKDDMVKLLLNRRADAFVFGGPKRNLALHNACQRPSGVLTIVQQLIRNSSKDCRMAQDKDGDLPLFLAAESGNTSVCRELLQHEAREQVRKRRRKTNDTVLHISCRRKDFDMSRLFVDNGAEVDAQNIDGHTPLHVCAWEGDDGMVKFLNQHKANANMNDNLDRTPLHIAAERGHTAIVELLVDKLKANVSARTKDGSTLMHIASQYGHPDTALAFLKKGVPLHMPNKNGALCLHAAAMKGHVNVIKALLTKGAHVDSKTKDGYTALHIAVEHCKPLAVQTLLGFGAQVELKGGQAKETPLHIASRVKDGEKCAEMLLKSGADVNAAQENGETTLHIAGRYGQLKMIQALLAEGADPTWQSKSGENPLHICVRNCHWEVADELLTFLTKTKSRIDATMLVNQQNLEGESPIHYAGRLSKESAHHELEDTDMIKLLQEYDGDVNLQTKQTHETSLHYCAAGGNADVMLAMVTHIGPAHTQHAVNKQAKNGWSPLLVASDNGHLEIVQILLKHNARVDVFDEIGKAALHLAAENGHDRVADVLLWHRAFVNAKNKLGVTPLHLAAKNGYNSLVKLLIETHSATIDALSLAKKTPLHLAAQNGQMEVCNTLLKMKADANATDVHGQTPLHLAAENDHSDVVKLFLKHRPELVTMANTNGMTCAHIAASKGSVAVVKELMRFNKNVVTTARNKTNDSTTLHLAAGGGHADVLQVLLDAGSSATDENADGMTAIHLAGRYGHISVLEALKDKVSWKVTSTKTGFTALHVAAHYGQMDFVREMLTKVPATIRSEAPHSGDSGVRDQGPEYGLTPLHLAAQSGHEGLVRMLLNSPGVQADVPTSLNGSIPLHLAAQSGHTSVVSLLLSKSTSQLHLKDKRGRTGLHLAALNGHIDMVALLLGQGADIDVYDKVGWTPLHFASKAGHLNVVQLLVEGGANPKYETKDGKVAICYAAAQNHAEVLSYLMKKDHDTHVLMEDTKFGFDLMVVGKQNDNESIEEFVLTSKAPVETAVKLSRQFRFLATKEKERAKDLLSAGDYCETMATELNAIASNLNTAGMLLKSVDSRGNPFLDVLIECEQKEVVSHPSVQKYLTEVWMGHLSHWPGWKMIMLFVVMMVVPPVWLAFCLPFRHRFNRVPIIKFMSYLVSHIYFIVLFILTVVVPPVPISWSGDLIPHWYEWLLLAWLSGLIVSQLTNPEDRAGLGWIKVIIIGVCVIGVIVHIIGFAFPYSVKPEDAIAGFNNNRLDCLYIRNQFFGFALMLCFVQMMDFLSFHHLFGPWAIIIRDLMKDLIRFLVILSIFMIGFTLNLSAVYQPVYDNIPLDYSKGNGTGAGGAITEDPFETFEMLFFALFGLVEPENLPPVHRHPAWSLSLVKTVFGVYLLVTLIVLINLLIAMMSDTYQRIQAQSDTEWKFGRAKLFRNMNKTSATPSPLNLVTKLFVYLKVLIKHKGKVCNMHAQHYIDEEEDLDTHANARAMEALSTGGHSPWLRNMVRRNTTISPDGDFLHAGLLNQGPTTIEEVVNWRQVVDKYKSLRGQGEGDGVTERLPEDFTDTAENVNETKTAEPNAA